MKNYLYWTLRIACVAIYVGHGMFGVLGGKAAWLPYFAVVGIPEHLAWPLMRLVGVVDVSAAIFVLFMPTLPLLDKRLPLYYMVFWGFWTALLRPLAGEGWWEFMERFPNWIVPLAFLLMHFKRPIIGIKEEIAAGESDRLVSWCLRLGAAVHFIGHGGYGAFMHKAVWYDYLGVFGVTQASAQAANLVSFLGRFEIALGFVLLLRPRRAALILGFALMAFDPGARLFVGEPVWEFIERGGNMVAPIALVMLMAARSAVGRAGSLGRVREAF